MILEKIKSMLSCKSITCSCKTICTVPESYNNSYHEFMKEHGSSTNAIINFDSTDIENSKTITVKCPNCSKILIECSVTS